MAKISKQLLGIVILAFIAGGFLLFQQNAQRIQRNESSETVRTFDEKTAVANGVTVEAQPVSLPDGGLQFSIRLTTHSGNLVDYDAGANVRLRNGSAEVAPRRAENAAGSGPSEHHRVLTAVFPKLENGSFTLVMRQLGGVPETTLRWP